MSIQMALSTQMSVMLFAAAAMITVAPSSARAVEQAQYVVVQSDEDIEIRDYPALIVAETLQPGDRDEASNPAFRRLAGYIFDDERPEGEIAMTAPVLMAPAGSALTSMQFVMPRQYEKAELPAPKDSGVAIKTVPSRRMVAIRFSGWADDDDLAEQETALRAWMAQQNVEPISPAVWAFYNPPWTLGPWRRNEVLIEIAP